MLFSRANLATFSTSLVIQACGGVTGILTARLLGPQARGELATVILWPTIFSNLGLMGCSWALSRAVALEPDQERNWMSAGVAVGVVFAVIYSSAAYFLIPLLIPPKRFYLVAVVRLCLLLIPLDVLNQILLAAEQGRMRWRRYNLLRLSFFVFYLVLIGVIAFTRSARIVCFVWAFLASHFLALLIRLWIHRKSLCAETVALERCRRLVRGGTPYFGATIGNLISLQFDTILVVSLLSAESAGIYAVATAFANGQSSLGDALGITSFAVLSNEHDPRSHGRIVGETFRQSALLSSGAGLALALLVPFLVVHLFGAGFARAVRPAMVLALAASLTASTNILNQGLRGAGRPHAGLVSQLTGTGAMAFAGFFLLRRFGLLGMAFAVWISASVQLLVLIGAAATWLRISPLEFWPFRAGTLKLFGRQILDLRLLLDSHSAA